MKIGIYSAMQWSPEEKPDDVLRSLREQVRLARDAGFASLMVGQHMLIGPVGMFQPIPMLAALADEAKGMQIGPGVLLLSMLNPVLTAEEGATLDWISDGNYALCVGLGYRPEEFQAMGVDIKQRVGRLVEGVEIVKRLWTEESVDFHGKHFTLDAAKPAVRPKQRPRPPIWVGGDVEPAVRRAARIGDAWCAAPTISMDTLMSYLAAFREERAAHGLDPDVPCPVIREVFVGKTAAHAKEASRGPLMGKYQAYASWGQSEASAGGDLDAQYDAFAKNRFIVGDSEAVKDEILRYGAATGTDRMIFRMQWAGQSHAETMGNIERVGRIISDIT